MGKRRVLPQGGPEKNPTNRTGKSRRRFSKTGLGKYLKADTHLYAPLVARVPSDPRPSKGLRSFITGLRGRGPSKVKAKRLLEKIVDYLKSDSYMYASLTDAGSISPSPASGQVQVEKVTVVASRTVMAVKEVLGRPLPAGPAPQSALPENLRSGHSEMVKNKVYNNYRTSSSPGKEPMSRELRRLAG